MEEKSGVQGEGGEMDQRILNAQLMSLHIFIFITRHTPQCKMLTIICLAGDILYERSCLTKF